jgi:hypothetical protein
MIAAACALVLHACGGDDLPGDPKAVVELWPIPSQGRPPPPPTTAGSAGSSVPPRQPFVPPATVFDSGIGSDEDAGPPMDPDPTLALLDPEQVYLFGTMSEGTCNRLAIAPVLAPDHALVGFACETTVEGVIRPSDGRLIYSRWSAGSYLVHAFHCDGCVYASSRTPYPASPIANDEWLPAPTCATPGATVTDYAVAIDGEIIIGCSDRSWYRGDGAQIAGIAGAPNPLLGHGGSALVSDGVVDLASGMLAPFDGLGDRAWLTTRVREDGYWIAAQPMDDPAVPPELWKIAFDGTATLLGMYPSPPPNQQAYRGYKLDGVGRLVQFARSLNSSSETIIRRDIDGASEVIYDEADDPVVKIHLSSLFTGP